MAGSSSQDYTIGATMFGIGVSAQTGYTRDIVIDLDNRGGAYAKAACGIGSSPPAQSPVLVTGECNDQDRQGWQDMMPVGGWAAVAGAMGVFFAAAVAWHGVLVGRWTLKGTNLAYRGGTSIALLAVGSTFAITVLVGTVVCAISAVITVRRGRSRLDRPSASAGHVGRRVETGGGRTGAGHVRNGG